MLCFDTINMLEEICLIYMHCLQSVNHWLPVCISIPTFYIIMIYLILNLKFKIYNLITELQMNQV